MTDNLICTVLVRCKYKLFITFTHWLQSHRPVIKQGNIHETESHFMLLLVPCSGADAFVSAGGGDVSLVGEPNSHIN